MQTLIERGCGLRRTSSHSSGLFVDRPQGRKGSEGNANVRHHYEKAGGSARMVAL